MEQNTKTITGNSQSKPESLPRRQTDPAWLQDCFLKTGHDEETNNATVTFVKRHGHYYAVTCRHVAESVTNPKIVPGAKFPTIALHVNQSVLNLSGFSAQGYTQAIKSPDLAVKDIDIGIAQLDGGGNGHWHMLSKFKNKVPIDLDQWREPDWRKIKYCLAAGYPDEHKERIKIDDVEKLTSPFFSVVAEIASKLGRAERVIVLHSSLDKAHGYYFSGMSGGPIYAIEGREQEPVEDEELFPIGIIFEGFPGSKKANEESTNIAQSFLSDKDLFFRGLILSPETFDEWLLAAGIVT